MKYKIVVDSSSDIRDDYIVDKDVGFEVVPLSINVDGVSYNDDKNLNVDEMLAAMHASKSKSTSSCPSCGYFAKSYDEADYTVCITMTSKLSGTYNSAYLGSQDCKGKVHVVDSKATSGVMQLLVDKAYELMKQDLDFEVISNSLEEYKESLNLFFVLDKFENLVKSGRMSKITAFIANALYIKPLCVAKEGVIEILEKPRTRKGAISRLIENIKSQCSDPENRKCIITYCKCQEEANELKDKIQATYKFKDVIVNEMKGLCSYYALEKGIIVSF